MKKFFMDESGQGMVEYGLIIALVSIAAIVALKALGPKVKEIFNSAATELGSVTPGTTGGATGGEGTPG